MLCQDKMAIKTCTQCYIACICISISIRKNVLLNTNYSQNTSLFMTYFPEPFHNKYKSDVRHTYIHTHTCT